MLPVHPRRATTTTRILCRHARRLTTPSGPSHVRHRAQERIAEIDALRPASAHLVDTFGRKHDYLRISLTERCNLRCFYCMPSEGIDLSPEGKLLTNDEMLRLAKLFVQSGVTKIRLTGGEPTVRKGIVDIVKNLNRLREYGLKSIGMTTNGIVLHRYLPQLVENGLTHLNLSLDTLDPFKFEIITRRRGHQAVLKVLDAALAAPLESVKLNVVVIKGVNDHEVLNFVELAKERPISVRFIEFMPFTGNKWDKQKMVQSSDLLAKIQQQHPDLSKAPDELNDTARSWLIPGYAGSFGFISSMSDHFCSSCNRLRLTADGQIKVCLFDPKEISLREQMRQGASDDQLLHTIGTAVLGKKAKHAGMEDIEDIDVVNNRPMILIGGSLSSFRHQLRSPPFRLTRHVKRVPAHLMPTLYPASQATLIRFYSTKKLTHLDDQGRASMVDVSSKTPSKRTAVASGRITVPKIAYDLVMTSYPNPASPESESSSPAFEKARRKGDALTVAQLAGIMGAKQTSNLIPLCHPLALSKIDVRLTPERRLSEGGDVSKGEIYSILCTASVTCEGKTGVEMEALTGVSVALLTVWDMLKAVAGKEMEIGQIVVESKEGGKSGDFTRTR